METSWGGNVLASFLPVSFLYFITYAMELTEDVTTNKKNGT
jgi:hypothetical protein